jgi:hypothetical protein
VPTDIPSRIAARLYAYARTPNAQLSPSPVSGHEAMPAELRLLFDRAFDGPGAGRPSPLEWGAALKPYAQRASLKLVGCKQDPEHQHFAGLPCAACNRDALISKTASKRGQPIPTAAPAAAVGGGGQVRTGFGRKTLKPNFPAGFPRPGTASRPPQVPRNLPPMRSTPIPYPAWANTGTRRWLFAQYWNATPEQIVKFIVFMVFIGFIVVMNLVRMVGDMAAHLSGSDQYVPPPAQSVAPPPAPPPAESGPAQVLGPIASPIDSPTFTGPPDAAMIASTQKAVDAVALGNSANDRQQVDTAMSELVRNAPRPTSVGRRIDNQQRFRGFLQGALPASNEQRREDMLKLAAYLHNDPFDAEAACEWSWLATLSYDREAALNGFLRAIWADPQASCGWLGYGSLINDTPTSFGALVMAERLQEGGPQDYEHRDQLVESTLVPDNTRAQRWRIMDARARVRAAELRGTAVPREIELRAQQLLPQ